ncbi:MAG: hydroxylase [Nocardioidaceae bacterium]|nr:hydroxylase [Nocardioidaceae bacterium]
MAAKKSSPPTTSPAAFDDPLYREGVVDLLGVLAFGELTAFERLAEDAKLAPDIQDKAEIAAMAAAEFEHFLSLRKGLEDLGVDPFEAMAPFHETFEKFHARTAPADWLEGLVKAYVGDGLAADFYTEIAAFLDEKTRALVMQTMNGTGHSEFVVDRVRAAIVANPRVGGRLALWGRRLVGEALSQAQAVAAEHDGLTAVLVGGADRPGMDLAGIGRMFARLTEAHAERMAKLGLAS